MGYTQAYFDLKKFVENCFIKQKHIATNDNIKL